MGTRNDQFSVEGAKIVVVSDSGERTNLELELRSGEWASLPLPNGADEELGQLIARLAAELPNAEVSGWRVE